MLICAFLTITLDETIYIYIYIYICPFALRIGEKHSVWCISLMCIVYIAYMGTVVLIVKISFIRFEDKLFTFCTLCLRVLFTFHIYLNTISYQVAAG